MTTKGKENLVKTLKDFIKTTSRCIERHIKVVLSPLLECFSLMDAVNNGTAVLNRLYAEVTDSHARLCGVLDCNTDI